MDGSNWQYVDLFDFQIDVSVLVVENLAKRCNEFLKGIRLENCRSLTDEAIMYFDFILIYFPLMFIINFCFYLNMIENYQHFVKILKY